MLEEGCGLSLWESVILRQTQVQASSMLYHGCLSHMECLPASLRFLHEKSRVELLISVDNWLARGKC